VTERFSKIQERIDSVSQLSSVVAAIRGIAAARLREGEDRLNGVRAYAEVVGIAIGEALALVGQEGGPEDAANNRQASRLVLALCSEQGFVGGYNSRILDRAALLANVPGSELIVVGNHGLMIAEEHGLQVVWSAPMAVHVDEANGLANRLAGMLYDKVRQGAVSAVVIHAKTDTGDGQSIDQKALIPFDFSRFPATRSNEPPLLNLSSEELLAQLAEEYIFAELCEAVILGFAAENETRMRSMISAQDNVRRRLDELRSRSRRIRQEEITSEVVELAAGVQASTARANAPD